MANRFLPNVILPSLVCKDLYHILNSHMLVSAFDSVFYSIYSTGSVWPDPTCKKNLHRARHSSKLTTCELIYQLYQLVLFLPLFHRCRNSGRKFPGSPVVRTACYHCQRWGFDPWLRGFLGGSDGKASACDAEDLGLIPGLGRSPGEGNVNPLQYFCLENPMEGEAWWATYSLWGRKESDTTGQLHFTKE